MKYLSVFSLILLIYSCSDQGKTKESKIPNKEIESFNYSASLYFTINDSLSDFKKVDYSISLFLDSNVLTWTKYNLDKNKPLIINGIEVDDSLVFKASLDKFYKYDKVLNWSEFSSSVKQKLTKEFKNKSNDSTALTILFLSDIGGFNLGLNYLKQPDNLHWSVDKVDKKGNKITLTIIGHTQIKHIKDLHSDLYNCANPVNIDEESMVTNTSKIIVDLDKKAVQSIVSNLSFKDQDANVYSKTSEVNLK